MTCPDGKPSKWFKDGKEVTNWAPNKSLTLTYGSYPKGTYYCQYGEDPNKHKYYFYVEGKGELQIL